MMRANARSKGFSLIEALIALLLICVGILGMVALQGKAIPYTQDSTQRNNAAMLASELVEILRSDPSNVSAYLKKSGVAFPDAPSSCVPLPTAAASRMGCWAARVANTLPGTTAALLKSGFYVCKSVTPKTPGNCTTGSAVEIQLSWTVKAGECMDASSGTTCTYSLRTEL